MKKVIKKFKVPEKKKNVSYLNIYFMPDYVFVPVVIVYLGVFNLQFF